MISQCKLCHHHSNCHCSACPMVSGCLNSTLGMRKSTRSFTKSFRVKRILQGKMCWKTYCFYFIRQEENIKSNEHIFHSSKIFKYFSQNPSTFQGLEGGISFSSTFKHFFSFSRIRTHPATIQPKVMFAKELYIPPAKLMSVCTKELDKA